MSFKVLNLKKIKSFIFRFLILTKFYEYEKQFGKKISCNSLKTTRKSH
jgi:hypothetical protein